MYRHKGKDVADNLRLGTAIGIAALGRGLKPEVRKREVQKIKSEEGEKPLSFVLYTSVESETSANGVNRSARSERKHIGAPYRE